MEPRKDSRWAGSLTGFRRFPFRRSPVPFSAPSWGAVRGWRALFAVAVLGFSVEPSREAPRVRRIDLDALPLIFEPNAGQFRAGVRFAARSRFGSLAFE